MCCIFGFIKWSLSCLQRSLTFVLGFWVVLMVLYAIALAIGAGVAFGYDYCLAEYTVLARSDVRVGLKPREYTPEILYRRSGDVSGDEFKGADNSDSLINLVEMLPSWLYKSTTKYIEYSVPTHTTQRSTSLTRTRTAKRKKAFKVSKAPKMVLLSTKTKSHKVSKASKNVQRSITRKLSTVSTASEDVQPSTTRKLRKLAKASENIQPDTTKKDKTNQFSNFMTNFWESITDSSTSVTTSPKVESKSPEAKTTETKSINDQTSPLPPSVMRIFVPKSTLLKWRPTKPEIFFYKTPATNYRRRKMKENSYHPEMEIRIPSYGSNMWNWEKIVLELGTEDQCVQFAENRGLIPASKMCRIHRKPMTVAKQSGKFGKFRCRKSNCRSESVSRAKGTWFDNVKLPLVAIFRLMFCFSEGLSYNATMKHVASRNYPTITSSKSIADWFTFCREAVMFYEMDHQESKGKIGGPNKIVQIDESKFGKRKYNRGRYIEGHWVIGMIEDGSDELRLEVCPDNERSAEVLVPLIKKHVEEGSIIHTDYWRAYDCLPQHGYIHKKVNHSDPENRFVAPDGTHTQRIESQWRGLKKIFREKQHKHDFTDWLMESLWRRRVYTHHLDPFEELIIAIKYIYKVDT